MNEPDAKNFAGEIATFNPAMLENQDFYNDVMKAKYLISNVEEGDFSKISLFYGVLKNARRHFWFKLHPNFQKIVLQKEREFKTVLDRWKIDQENPIIKNKLYEIANECMDNFFIFKERCGLSIQFKAKPMSNLEVLDRALGLSDIPLKDRMTLQGLAARVQESLKADWDSVIAITGAEGVGKSHLAIILGHLIRDDFSLDKNVAFVPDEKQIFNLVTGLPKGSAIVLDEAIKSFYKLNWNSRLQIMLNELFTLCRSENKATILCIPSLLDLNKMMRGRRVCMWIHVVKRGKFVIFTRDSNPYNEDPWHFDETIKKIKKEKINFNRMHSRQQVAFLSKLPNYIGYLYFEKMTNSWSKRYEELKHDDRYKDMILKMSGDKKGSKVEQKARVKLINIVTKLRESGKSWENIRDITGMPRTTCQTYYGEGKAELFNK